MARANTKIGDVFSVEMDSGRKKFMQYIVSDKTQLNSDVIRAFENQHEKDEDPDLLDVVRGDVDFYAHCVTKLGVMMGLWRKVGNISDVGDTGHILFRHSGDVGLRPEISISHNWWVWKINEKMRNVGKLQGVHQNAEIGMVISPISIVHRMRTGEYGFKGYPNY